MKLGTFYEYLDLAYERKEEKSIPNMLDKYRELGLSYVDIELANTDKYGCAEDFSAMLSKHGFSVGSAYYSIKFGCRSFKEVIAMKDDTRRNIEYAGNAGCKIFMPVTIVTGKYKNENERIECRKLISEYVAQASEISKEYGITTVIENFSDTRCPFAWIEDIQAILDYVKDARYVLDTGNFWFGGDDVLTAAENFAEKTVHVHLKDISPSENGFLNICGKSCDSVSIGKGIIPFDDIFNILKRSNYSGGLSIEINDMTELVKKICESAVYVKNRW